MVTKQDKIDNKPQVQVENAILGCIFLDNDQLVNIIDIINEDMFSFDANSKLFKIMHNLFENKRIIDKITVWSEVISNGLADSFLTEQHVNSLAEGGGVFSPKNAKDYAYSLSKRYGSNLIPQIAQEFLNEAKSKKLTIEEGISIGQKYLQKLEKQNTGNNFYHKPEIDEFELFQDIEDKISGKTCTGLSCGIETIDKKINGFEKGKIYNFTGSPGTGKTNYALQAILNNAKLGLHILYCSFEMGVPELTLRLICMEENLNSWAIDDPIGFINKLIEKRIVNNLESGKEWIKDKIRSGKKKIEALNIEIYRPEEASVIGVKTAIDKYLIQNRQLDLVVVDHLDLMHDHKNAASDLYYICKRLKDYAVNYNMPILTLHQFNRAEILNSPDYKPTIFALKGGQALNDNMDVIMLLWRADVFKDLIEKKPELKGKCEVSYAKRRGGKQMENTELKFNGIKFRDANEIILER